MKKLLFLLVIILSLLIPFRGAFSEDDAYYARCNLKVIKGSYITWVNWQSTKTLIPVGTRLNVVIGSKGATITDVETGKTYSLDTGSSGDPYLEKFVTREKIDIGLFPDDVQRNIANAVAKVGMTKEQVYIAMGPPAWAGKNTDSMTYTEIMRENLWTYKRKRFAKNIGVSFDPVSGLVDKTEGIWGK
ncbi:MAG: hypothetical protein AMK71_05690 [Nitrospira bacterium SG8_35_4]|nr:MAG: hypothetical protein AMK71_05690 [Nitrospira bacterium SG8_35_4]